MEQRLREIQEVLADHEYRVGDFYFRKGSFPASTNRLDAVVDHYPLYSNADDALWKLGEAYAKMGPRFEAQSIEAYERIASEYPLSPYADRAREKLTDMEREVPEPDPVALARMEYELENYESAGRMSNFWNLFRKAPKDSIRAAAKSGTPAAETMRPSIPVSVPGQAPGAPGEVSADVTVSTVGDGSALDTQPDARRVQPNLQQEEENQP
jgi:outer membrane protein assembly factor BamD